MITVMYVGDKLIVKIAVCLYLNHPQLPKKKEVCLSACVVYIFAVLKVPLPLFATGPMYVCTCTVQYALTTKDGAADGLHTTDPISGSTITVFDIIAYKLMCFPGLFCIFCSYKTFVDCGEKMSD